MASTSVVHSEFAAPSSHFTATGSTKPSFRIYNLPGEEDFFLNHANAVLLGFLATVALLLVAISGLAWIGFQLWG